MSGEDERWMDEVFESMKGSQRAKPKAALFAKIEDQLNAPKDTGLPIQQWRAVAAAAVLVFCTNAAALAFYDQGHEPPFEDVVVQDAYDQPLVSSYQIYEQ